jgi:hypothetical protein
MAKRSPGTMKTNWHVSTAAEAIAAAQFARLGFNVSVQYGANQPEYDLMVDDGDRTLKISVKVAPMAAGDSLKRSYRNLSKRTITERRRPGFSTISREP